MRPAAKSDPTKHRPANILRSMLSNHRLKEKAVSFFSGYCSDRNDSRERMAIAFFAPCLVRVNEYHAVYTVDKIMYRRRSVGAIPPSQKDKGNPWNARKVCLKTRTLIPIGSVIRIEPWRNDHHGVKFLTPKFQRRSDYPNLFSALPGVKRRDEP